LDKKERPPVISLLREPASGSVGAQQIGLQEQR